MNFCARIRYFNLQLRAIIPSTFESFLRRIFPVKVRYSFRIMTTMNVLIVGLCFATFINCMRRFGSDCGENCECPNHQEQKYGVGYYMDHGQNRSENAGLRGRRETGSSQHESGSNKRGSESDHNGYAKSGQKGSGESK